MPVRLDPGSFCNASSLPFDDVFAHFAHEGFEVTIAGDRVRVSEADDFHRQQGFYKVTVNGGEPKYMTKKEIHQLYLDQCEPAPSNVPYGDAPTPEERASKRAAAAHAPAVERDYPIQPATSEHPDRDPDFNPNVRIESEDRTNGDELQVARTDITTRRLSQANLNVYLERLNKGDRNGLTDFEKSLVAEWSKQRDDFSITPLIRMGGSTTVGYVVRTGSPGMGYKEVTYDRNGRILERQTSGETPLQPANEVLFAAGLALASAAVASARTMTAGLQARAAGVGAEARVATAGEAVATDVSDGAASDAVADTVPAGQAARPVARAHPLDDTHPGPGTNGRGATPHASTADSAAAPAHTNVDMDTGGADPSRVQRRAQLEVRNAQRARSAEREASVARRVRDANANAAQAAKTLPGPNEAVSAERALDGMEKDGWHTVASMNRGRHQQAWREAGHTGEAPAAFGEGDHVRIDYQRLSPEQQRRLQAKATDVPGGTVGDRSVDGEAATQQRVAPPNTRSGGALEPTHPGSQTGSNGAQR